MKPIVGTQLVREHPLARGLVNAWLLNEGDGLRAGDSVARIRGVGDVGVSTAVQWGGGKPARFNGSTSRFRITASSNLANTSASSIFAVVTSFATAYDGVIFSKGSDGSGFGWGHILTTGTGGFNGAVVTSGQTNCIGGTVAVGKQTAVCSTWRGDTRALRLFQDGVLVQSATSAGATLRYANDSSIGAFFGSGYAVSSLFNGIIHCVFRWNRALAPDEVDALSADPYQMFDRSSATGIWVPSNYNQALTLTAETGAFTVTGQDANLTPALLLDAETGQFTVTGQDADLIVNQGGQTLNVAPGKPRQIRYSARINGELVTGTYEDIQALILRIAEQEAEKAADEAIKEAKKPKRAPFLRILPGKPVEKTEEVEPERIVAKPLVTEYEDAYRRFLEKLISERLAAQIAAEMDDEEALLLLL